MLILSTRNVMWHGRSSRDQPPLKTSRTFFDSAGAPEAIFIVQALRSRAVYKSTLGTRPGPDNEHTNIL